MKEGHLRGYQGLSEGIQHAVTIPARYIGTYAHLYAYKIFFFPERKLALHKRKEEGEEGKGKG